MMQVCQVLSDFKSINGFQKLRQMDQQLHKLCRTTIQGIRELLHRTPQMLQPQRPRQLQLTLALLMLEPVRVAPRVKLLEKLLQIIRGDEVWNFLESRINISNQIEWKI